ncbi:class I adenylate-forming enzyme family protein [Caballeronia sordidicola]|uniref:O-succinylbenzoic acid--CoA ligase n=1 Tax=Caballeronia sordidicola TaxID=196367 RepID=A0A242N6H2_CABSO|nr:class I adenylate-forming enzyme family protein [Caballeronia sordidicola]OTP79024.1 O-succinylbenzoic acid--CoA ligase [Caballeronia sordidicola]
MHYPELLRARQELTGAGGAFEMTDTDVLGRRMRVFRHAPASVREFWLATAQFADRPYLVYQDERMTYGEAHARVNALAAWLWARGARPGDRVAIAMRNYPEWLMSYWACLSIGVAAVGMNTWWVGTEMVHALADSAPKVLIADGESLARLRDQKEAVEKIEIIGVRLSEQEYLASPEVTRWAEVVASGGKMPEVTVDADDDACIFYTSGTTSFPKGARQTHRGCVTNVFGMKFARASTDLATARATEAVSAAKISTTPVMLLTTPLFHVTANNCCTYPTTADGGTLVLMHRWDAGEALRLIASEKVTSMSGVPTMAREVLSHPDFTATDTSSLVSLAGGGAQLPPDLVVKIDTQVATARPSTGYGLTELSGIIAWIGDDFFVDKPESVGPAFPTHDLKLVDDDGQVLPPGGVGELWVRGPSMIKGYLNQSPESETAIVDGWLHTGDIARIDEDGFIFIVGRKKDMVIRGGENISCAEVEACLYRHAAVAECCVFSVPDERLGEEVGAAILLQSGERVETETLREHCRKLMAKYKVPRYIWLMEDALPKNASGKILRREIRNRLVRSPLAQAS